jgi:glyoxylase-like metal-dependent hydrolase (beta-lactamase superfamily II)
MPEAQFETLTPHVDRFTPDDRTDRPALGAVHGTDATLLVEGGASVAHLRSFVAELDARGRPPAVAIVLTHWHWDHSFGSAAVRVPVIGQRETARELQIQSGYDFSDDALDQRVADGTELDFCRDMMKLEIPDRSDLELVVPTVIVDDTYTVDLGGVTAVIDHVGGDHAPDSLAVHVPEDGALFLGDCLYQKLHTPVHHLTVDGVRGLAGRLDGYDVRVAVEGHDDDVHDTAAFAARLAQLRTAADLVERCGADAREHAAGDEELGELVGFLIAGERLQADAK